MDFAALLHPYITGLSGHQLAQVSTYLDLLLRWNQKTNLTAIRDPEQIVTRHFGESFFLAHTLLPSPQSPIPSPPAAPFVITSAARDLHSGFQLPITNYQLQILDLGSGAGVPAIPLLILHPSVTLTLIEAHHTKAVFLREVLRALHLQAEVKNVRAESLPPASADLVTFRAVEKFDSILPIAARLVCRKDDGCPTQPSSGCEGLLDHGTSIPQGDPESVHQPPSTVHPIPLHLSPIPRGLALLIGSNQVPHAHELLPNWRFHPSIPVPKSQKRVIQLAEPNE